MTIRKRAAAITAVVAVLFSVSLVGSSPLATVDAELLRNGSFEDGFTYQEGCGMVGEGWQCFTNGGTAAYGFYDEMWGPVVWDGEHSQLIEINTHQIGGDPDRYSGLYQTVDVLPGSTYNLSLRGMLRADDDDPDPWRYRVQVGFDHSGGTNWAGVTDWIELPWDDIHPRTSPGSFDEYSTTVLAQGSRLTVYVRVWMKWGTWYRELDVNIDGISLYGPMAAHHVWEDPCEAPPDGPPEHHPMPYPPAPEMTLTCDGPNLLANGDFESGFLHGVGGGWGSFNNGGAASYGFYDDMWAPVVAGGEHSQLIEINTYGLAAADPDRYAGIQQTVCGLWPGATYEFSLAGMIRQGVHGWDGDPFRYRVEWGYSSSGSADWTGVGNWEELPWDTIYPRAWPGDMESFAVRFEAPSNCVTLYLRAWKKWGRSFEELDVNLDQISLLTCVPEMVSPPVIPCPHEHSCLPEDPCMWEGPCLPEDPWSGDDPWAPEPLPAPEPPGDLQCSVHSVRRGDYLGAIAAAYGTTVNIIIADNALTNPNVIYVGQELLICGP